MASKSWFNFVQAKDPKTAARNIKWRLFITEFDIFIGVYQPCFSISFSFVSLRVALRASPRPPPSLCSAIDIHSIVIKLTLYIEHTTVPRKVVLQKRKSERDNVDNVDSYHG